MRILWVCNVCLPEIASTIGIEASNKEGWISGLANHLLKEKNNIELGMAFPVPKQFDNCKGEAIVNGEKLKYYGFFEDIKKAEKTDATLAERIGSIIKDFNPDLIHCFGTEYDHTYEALKAADNRKTLVSIQGICTVIADKYMANLPVEVQRGFTIRDILRNDTLYKAREKFKKRGERERLALKITKNVVGRTDFDREFVKKINPSAKYFVQNETLRKNFYDGKWSKDNCVSGRLFISQGDYPLKGLHYLIIAAGKLKDKYPELKICVAGNSLIKTDLKSRLKISRYGLYLKSLIKKYSLEDRVEFLGKLSKEEMKEQYLSCSGFVCCSANENSPNSLGEAMLLGVPCVAGKVGGIPSVFFEGKDGIAFEMEGKSLQEVSDNLYEAIDRIWSDPEKTGEYVKNARNHAKITHNPQDNVEKMIEIYHMITEETK